MVGANIVNSFHITSFFNFRTVNDFFSFLKFLKYNLKNLVNHFKLKINTKSCLG